MAASACNEGGEIGERRFRKDTATKEQPEVAIDSYSKDFQKLIQSPHGTFRGINLGDPASEVKKQESKSEIEEETSDNVDYMVNYGEFEEAEVSYLLDKAGKVKAIETHIYPRNKESQDSLYNEFNKFFTAKYGKASTVSDSALIWELKEPNLFINIEKKGTAKVHDINLRFSYLSNELTSSLY